MCMKAFMDSKSLYDNDCHDIERVVTPLPTSLLDVKPENLVCLFQSPLEDTTTSCTFIVTFQRCVVLGDNEMEERRAQVIMERQWSNGNAHCTVITRFSDDDLYSSLEQSSQCSVDSKSSSIPTMPSPPSLKTPDGGATVGPGGTCAFRLPVTPETARKEEPQHPAYRTTVGGDDVIAVEHRNDQGQLRSASSPISPLLSFNTLPEFCPPAQSVASVSSEHMLPPDQEDSRHIPDYLNWDQEQELEENQLVQASPCVSPTLAVRISPITSEEMEQCVDERVQENTFEIGETGELCDRDEEASLTVEASSLQTYPLVTSETLTEEQLEEQELHRHEEKDNGQGLERYEFEGAVDETQTIMTSPRLNSPPARVHCQSRPNTVPSSSSFATAKPQNLSPSPTQSPRVSGVFDNLLWAVLTLTSTTSTDGVDNQIGDVDSSTSSVGSRSRSSSYNSLAELNVHVSDPGTAAES